MTVQRRTYRIKGLVQGVGFRPTLWRVAHALKLAGEVWNDAQGVGAILEGDVSVLNCFEEALRKTVQDEAPLARIDSVELVQTQPPRRRNRFRDHGKPSRSGTHDGDAGCGNLQSLCH